MESNPTRKIKQGICAYCSASGDVTGDHVIPQCLWPGRVPKDAPVVAIEVEAGDLIRVPRGTLHWFNLCGDRRIRAIRLFQDTAGWTPHYTDSRVDENFMPVCFGVSHLSLTS